MAIKKIPCGGFYYNDETVNFDDDVMTVVGGGNVPDPEAADIGKVLGIVEDGTGAKYAPVADGGLPDPSALSDGIAMVAVNGEWKMQEGYGYTDEPAFEPITWDGDTEGREHIDIDGIPVFFKISDEILAAAQFNGATLVVDRSGEEMSFVLLDEDIEDMRGCVEAVYVLSGISGTYTSETYGEFVIPYDGTYFHNSDGVHVSSLTAAPSVHQFDSALIPAVIPAAPSEDGTYVLTCTVTDGEPTYSWETNA